MSRGPQSGPIMSKLPAVASSVFWCTLLFHLLLHQLASRTSSAGQVGHVDICLRVRLWVKLPNQALPNATWLTCRSKDSACSSATWAFTLSSTTTYLGVLGFSVLQYLPGWMIMKLKSWIKIKTRPLRPPVLILFRLDLISLSN